MTKVVNKVIINNEVKLDLTGDTAVESDVATGKIFHKADGSIAIGEASSGGEEVDLYASGTEPTGMQDGDLWVQYEGSQRPTVGFVPTEYDSSGYVTKGTWYGDGSKFVPSYGHAQYNATYATIEGSKLKEVTLDNMKGTSTAAFRACQSLETVLFTNADNTVTIFDSSFYQCYALKNITIPENVTYMGYTAFYKCTSLTEIRILGRVNVLDSQCFSGCSNLLDIYVPWSDGEIAGAPWGASNATVHYNS